MKTRTQVFLIFVAAVGYTAVTFLGAGIALQRYTLVRSEEAVPDAGSVAQVLTISSARSRLVDTDPRARYSTTVTRGDGGNVVLGSATQAIFAPLDERLPRPSVIRLGDAVLLDEAGVIIEGVRVSADPSFYRRFIGWLQVIPAVNLTAGTLTFRGGAAAEGGHDGWVVLSGVGGPMLLLDDVCRDQDGRRVHRLEALSRLGRWLDEHNRWRSAIRQELPALSNTLHTRK